MCVISTRKRKPHLAMKLSNIFNQDHLLVTPPGSEKHCRLESFITRTIQKRKTFSTEIIYNSHHSEATNISQLESFISRTIHKRLNIFTLLSAIYIYYIYVKISTNNKFYYSVYYSIFIKIYCEQL
mgnify:CR=1 FL=1